METQSIRDRAAESAEPHDERHLGRDFGRPELVHHPRERENIRRASDETQNHRPDDQGRLELVLEGENRQAEVSEHAGLTHEGHGALHLLHRDLRDRRQVEVRVVTHNDAVEQDRHDAREVTALSQHVRAVGEDEEQRELQRRMFAQI